MKPQNIERQETSGALLNTDKTELERFRAVRAKSKEFANFQSELAVIKSDIAEIKDSIKKILDLLTNV